MPGVLRGWLHLIITESQGKWSYHPWDAEFLSSDIFSVQHSTFLTYWRLMDPAFPHRISMQKTELWNLHLSSDVNKTCTAKMTIFKETRENVLQTASKAPSSFQLRLCSHVFLCSKNGISSLRNKSVFLQRCIFVQSAQLYLLSEYCPSFGLNPGKWQRGSLITTTH